MQKQNFLPSLEELNKKYNFSKKQNLLKEPCPICNIREVKKYWWSCKLCTKIMSASSYNNWIITHQNYFKEQTNICGH